MAHKKALPRQGLIFSPSAAGRVGVRASPAED